MVRPHALRIAVLSLAAACGTAAAATVVYPTGSYPLDVQNVQAALDGGGTVLLKATTSAGIPATFNFGPADLSGGAVEFHVDAELTGERTASAQATIQGGWYPVEAPGLPLTIAVRDITFLSPFDGALLLYGAHTEVTGNRVLHTVGRFRNPFRTFAEVFVVAFSGRVRIEGNAIADVAAEVAHGVSQFGAAGPVVIRGNTISDTGYGTIESSFNVNSATGQPAVVSITDNTLRPGPAPKAFGVGIEINGEGSYYVARNDIVIESPNGLGVYALGAPDFGIAAMIAPVIEQNNVMVHPRTDAGPVFADGIDLVGVVQDAYVGHNAVTGTGFSALGLYDVAPDDSDLGFNTYVGNQIAAFDALVADVVLDTAAHDTVFKGFSGSVLDLGSNNHVTGAGNQGGASTGLQVREAARQRNDAMRATIDLLRQHGAVH
jgi:hypothetical protein